MKTWPYGQLITTFKLIILIPVQRCASQVVKRDQVVTENEGIHFEQSLYIQ
jgi:hypothetical protein